MNKDEYKNIIEPVVNSNNCILWGLEILRGKKRNTLRIFIDSNNIIDINDCENISNDLSYEPMLDVSLGDDYILEVSSPGVDRHSNTKMGIIGNELTTVIAKTV